MNEFYSGADCTDLVITILLYPHLKLDKDQSPEELYNQMYDVFLNINLEKERQSMLNKLIKNKENILSYLQCIRSGENAPL